MTRKKQVLHSIQHFLIGLALTLKGGDKLSHHPFIGGLILSFGIIILVYFFYILIRKPSGTNLSNFVHWFEAIACLFTAYILFRDGARFLPYVFLLASIGFFIALYISYKKARPVKKVTADV